MPITETVEPNRANSRRDNADPRSCIFSRDTADPIREKDRSESDDPRVVSSNTDILKTEPIRLMLQIDKEDPRRVKPRKDREEPS